MSSSMALVSPLAARMLLTGTIDLPKVGAQLVVEASCPPPFSPPPSPPLSPCDLSWAYPYAFSFAPVLPPVWPVLHASRSVPPPRGILKVPGASSVPHARRVAFGEVTVDTYPNWIRQASSWKESPWCRSTSESDDWSVEWSVEEQFQFDLMTDVSAVKTIVSSGRQEEDHGVAVKTIMSSGRQEEGDGTWDWVMSCVSALPVVAAGVISAVGVAFVGYLHHWW